MIKQFHNILGNYNTEMSLISVCFSFSIKLPGDVIGLFWTICLVCRHWFDITVAVNIQSGSCKPVCQSPSQNTLNHLAWLPSKQKSLQVWLKCVILNFIFFPQICQQIYHPNQWVARQLEIDLTFACTQTRADLSPLLRLSLSPSMH